MSMATELVNMDTRDVGEGYSVPVHKVSSARLASIVMARVIGAVVDISHGDDEYEVDLKRHVPIRRGKRRQRTDCSILCYLSRPSGNPMPQYFVTMQQMQCTRTTR